MRRIPTTATRSKCYTVAASKVALPIYSNRTKQQLRSVSSIIQYWRDVVRTGSLFPSSTNPLLDIVVTVSPAASKLKQQADEKDPTTTTASSTTHTHPPPVFRQIDYLQIRPHHLQEAWELVQKQHFDAVHHDLVSQLQTEIIPKKKDVTTESSSLSSPPPTTDEAVTEKLEQILTVLNDIEEPVVTLRFLATLCTLVISKDDARKQWERVAAQITGTSSSDWGRHYETLRPIFGRLQELLLKAASSSSSSENDATARTSRVFQLTWAANSILQRREMKYGMPRHSNAVDEANDDNLFQKYAESLEEIDVKILSTQSSMVTPRLTSLLYNSIGIRGERAKLLGYSSVMEQFFTYRRGSTTRDELDALHGAVKERIVPQILAEHGAAKTKEELALDDLMKASGNHPTNKYSSKSQLPQYVWDERIMLRLEHHVTLDGAMQFLCRIATDFFGITVRPVDKPSQAWHSDVKLYHVYDGENNNCDPNAYLGSFYLDPFQRPGKQSRSATIPIFPKTRHRKPLVCVSLELEPPAWDSDPTPLRWNDCESLFHEFGHVLQFLLARPEQSALLSPHNMALDVSELLPKFMEHWLGERSSLFALIDLSKAPTSESHPITQETIDAAYRSRSRIKALQMAEFAFFGSLELELFSGFDLKGSETIFDLQSRLAKEYIPHDVMGKNEATPILDVLKECASGREVAWYRYLWSDALTATLFENLKDQFASDPDSMGPRRAQFRELLLSPGAAIDTPRVRSELGLVQCSLDALCKRFSL